MPFPTLTDPYVGQPTLRRFFVLANQALAYLNGVLTGFTNVLSVANGSFESGSAADTAPDGWALSLAAGNSTAFDLVTPAHGRQAFSMTTPGAVSGGAILTTSDFMVCAAQRDYIFRWLLKATQVDVANAVKVKWYDEDEALISTVTLFSEAAANPATWTQYTVPARPPATARLFKIVLEGVNNTNDGTTYWDGVEVWEDTDAAGIIKEYAGSTLPALHLDCNGAAVSRTTYARLFADIGTTWGVGDGSTTFNLPDLRGRTAIGAGTGSGLTARTLGVSGGEENHVLSTAEMPAHTHDTIFSDNAGSTVPSVDGGAPDHSIASQSTGGGGGHNTMQPFAVVKKAIRY